MQEFMIGMGNEEKHFAGGLDLMADKTPFGG
jgi:hypothetical protein